MSYSPVPVERFGGLNLADDPGEVGWGAALDSLNVELDRRGRLRTRDGYAKVNAVAAANNLIGLIGWPSQQQFLTPYSGGTYAYNIAGTQLASTAVITTNGAASLGTAAAGPYLYLCQDSSTAIRRWDGTTFTSPAGMPNANFLAVQPNDNRLVAAGTSTTQQSRVQFSDAGAPETWGATNWVDLHPNDGQHITGMVAWRELLFVFKEMRYYVFTGNSTNSSGNPVFNYRTIDTGVGANASATFAGFSTGRGPCVAGSDGVYFVSPDGVFRTRGGPPERISSPIDPWFRGNLSSFTTLQGELSGNTSAYCFAAKDRIYISVVEASTPNVAYTFVYDPATDLWSVLQFGAATLRRGHIVEMANNIYVGGLYTAYFYKMSSASTDDDGTAIVSRYRSGFSDLGHPDKLRKVIRQWNLRGSGTVTFGVAADDATSIPTTAGGAQASVNLAGSRPNYRKAQRGQNFSWQASATSGAWRLDEVVAEVS